MKAIITSLPFQQGGDMRQRNDEKEQELLKV
jgi:hypothetical protein